VIVASKASAASQSYLVPDLLQPGLKLVFCGTAPSRASVAAAAYYAKSGNRFWPALHTVGITPFRFSPQDYPQLLNLGIGLTDLCKVHSGVDADLPDDAFDLSAFEEKMRAAKPKIIAFTSKNAAQSFLKAPVAYGEQSIKLGASRLFVLTSPSGLATRFFDIAIWRDLASEFSRI
jgi:TDG/mug DNA glycosylase family protein